MSTDHFDLIETLQKRYGLTFMGSENSLQHFARDWIFLTTPEVQGESAAWDSNMRRLTALWRFGSDVLPPPNKDFYLWRDYLDAEILARQEKP